MDIPVSIQHNYAGKGDCWRACPACFVQGLVEKIELQEKRIDIIEFILDELGKMTSSELAVCHLFLNRENRFNTYSPSEISNIIEVGVDEVRRSALWLADRGILYLNPYGKYGLSGHCYVS